MNKGNFEKLSKDERRGIILHYGDVTDNGFIYNIVEKLKPDEVYHLAAQSFVGHSFENPTFTHHTNIMGTL